MPHFTFLFAIIVIYPEYALFIQYTWYGAKSGAQVGPLGGGRRECAE